MNTYITLLRGINVSGKNIIRMPLLKKSLESLGFNNIRTYIQSGNIVFSTEEKQIDFIQSLIHKQIKKDFKLDINSIVLDSEKLKKIIYSNPFEKYENKNALYFTFLDRNISIDNKENIIAKLSDNEEIYVSNDIVYLYCPNGYGKTKITNTFLEKKLNVIATTRNLKTVNELLKISGQ